MEAGTGYVAAVVARTRRAVDGDVANLLDLSQRRNRDLQIAHIPFPIHALDDHKHCCGLLLWVVRVERRVRLCREPEVLVDALGKLEDLGQGHSGLVENLRAVGSRRACAGHGWRLVHFQLLGQNLALSLARGRKE
jgi:hypothetical protein